MFKVNRKISVGSESYLPNVEYFGSPLGISQRYIDVQTSEGSTKAKRGRKRAVVSNSAITNADKE